MANGLLRLGQEDSRWLLERLGPSLALWRAAEIAVLRRRAYERPVLDLGCGDGLVMGKVLPYVDIGLDPDPRALRQAAQSGVYGRLVSRPMETAALPPGRLGTIVSNSVLEHLPRLDRVLDASARALRPGGRLVFTAPTEAFSGWLAMPSARYAAWRNRSLSHLNLWSVGRWRLTLERAGFALEEVQPYLRRSLVFAWDALELAQQIWVGRYRAFSVFWRRLPAGFLSWLAARMAATDLGALPPGGGRLIVARRR